MSKKLRSEQLKGLLGRVKQAVADYKGDNESLRSDVKFKLMSMVQRFLESELTFGELRDERFHPAHIKKQLKVLEAVVQARTGNVFFGSKMFSAEELLSALHGERSRGLYANFCRLHNLNSAISKHQIDSSINRAGKVISSLFRDVAEPTSSSPRKEKLVNLLANKELLDKVQHHLQVYSKRKFKGLEVIQKIRFLTQLQCFLTHNGDEPYTIFLLRKQAVDFFEIYRQVRSQPNIGRQVLVGASLFVEGKKTTFGAQEFDLIQIGLIQHGKVCKDIIYGLGSWCKDLAREEVVGSSRLFPDA